MEGSFYPFLANHACITYLFYRSETVYHPKFLSQLYQGVSRARVLLLVVDLPDQRYDIDVSGWEDGGKFGFFVEVRVDQPAAYADDAFVVHEGVHWSQFRISR